MFTGLVEELGSIVEIQEDSYGKRLTVDAQLAPTLAIGDSLAINGCCLTVVERIGTRARFQAGPETLRKTNLGQLRPGDKVNLERSLAVGARLGGHFVQGHVDGVGTIRERIQQGEWVTLWFHAGALAGGMVDKGSIAVDGISLTIVKSLGDAFSVALIPHTLAVTTLGLKAVGASVNLETDILGKYVAKFLQVAGGNLSWEKLNQAGFGTT